MNKFLKNIEILDGFSLKVIAAATMFIDHVGYIFANRLPIEAYTAMRIIGRLSFPIFAFLLVEGFVHTKDRVSYLARIFGSGIVLIIVLTFLNRTIGIDTTGPLNIFMTLGVGFLVIWWIEIYWETSRIFTVVGTIAMAMLADFVRVDYGAFGVLMITFFYIFRDNKILNMLVYALFTIAYVLMDHYLIQRASLLQIFGIAVIPLLLLYNGKKGFGGKVTKYFFYFFYPVHFALLYLIRFMMFGI